MRVPNWNAEFLKALEAAASSSTEFAWVPPSTSPLGVGLAPQVHCLSFASYMVEAITGRNYYEELGGSLEYDSPKSALKALKSLGYSSVGEVVEATFPVKSLPYVIRGDLVLLQAKEELEGMKLMVAVADPPYAWSFYADLGLVKSPVSEAVKGYGVA